MINKYVIFELFLDYFKVSNIQIFLIGLIFSLYLIGIVNLFLDRGIEMIILFSVLIYSLLQEISMAVMRIKENFSLSVFGVVIRIY